MRANLLCHNRRPMTILETSKTSILRCCFQCKMFQLYSNSELFKLNVINLENNLALLTNYKI